MREKVERMVIKERIESDHHPVVMWMKGKYKSEENRERKKAKSRRGIWEEERIKEFRERRGKIEGRIKTVEEEIEETSIK